MEEIANIPGFKSNKEPKWETAQVRAESSGSTKKALEGFNIDYDAQIRSVILNEIAQGLQRTLMKKLNSLQDHPISFENLQYCCAHKWKFNAVIVNCQTGALLQDEAAFGLTPPSNVLMRAGSIYKIGKFFNVDIYVDPFMEWKDTTVYVLGSDVIEFQDPKVSDDGTSFVATIAFREIEGWRNKCTKLTLDNEAYKHL